MIRRIIQYTLLGIWLIAWWGVAAWFLEARYLGWQHIALFVAGLGLGLVARDLLAPEARATARDYSPTANNGHVDVHEALTTPLGGGR